MNWIKIYLWNSALSLKNIGPAVCLQDTAHRTPVCRECRGSGSRAAANDFDAKWCSRMSTCSDCEYSTFSPAQLLRSWCEQRPIYQGDLDSNVTAGICRVYFTGWTCYWFNFCTAVRDFYSAAF
jgi:hypothetical protein